MFINSEYNILSFDCTESIQYAGMQHLHRRPEGGASWGINNLYYV